MKEIMKKLALAFGLSLILSVAVNALQQQHKDMQMKDTTHMKSKKPVQKRSGESYQMKKGTAKQDKTDVKGSMEKMEDTSKIKSKGEPVYKR
jgi:high-affinity Fe2+/Pb2+ permease